MNRLFGYLLVWLFSIVSVNVASADALDDIRAKGVLRHLSIPYAYFDTGAGDGLDVELIKGFADYLGVRYQYVPTNWNTALNELTGFEVTLEQGQAKRGPAVPVTGDILASGITRLAWREQVVAFSDTLFPSSVWLVAHSDAPVRPIKPSGTLAQDIERTKQQLDPGLKLLSKPNTCLDASLYGLEGLVSVQYSSEVDVNEIAPAVMHKVSDTALLDVPDALVALDKWAGKIKVVGPISEVQEMAAAFRPEDTQLREAFNQYVRELIISGRYQVLVAKYYGNIQRHFPEFFERQQHDALARMSKG